MSELNSSGPAISAAPHLTRIARAVSAITLAAGMTAVHAQNAAPGDATAAAGPITEVVVTGTSLRGAAPVGTTVQVLGSEDLRASGMADTNDILKSVPQVVNLGADEGRGGGVQGAQGNVTQSKTVNLRGLGTESTLVLLNGRRIAPAGTQGAGYDTSMIPSNAIERVEVVADGASAIYGSEAVGGVINFITKRNYQGAETYLRYGFADGFDEKKFGQNFGYDWGSGNVFIAYEHYDRGGLVGSERKEVTQDLRPIGGPDLRGNFASPGTVISGGQTYATPRGTRGVGLLPGQFVPGTQNLEDINDTRSLLVDQKEDVAYLLVRQQVLPSLTLWAEGQYSDRVYDGLGTSLNRGAGTASLVVPNTNPFFVHPTNPAATSVNVNYSLSDAFPFISHGGEEAYGAAVGLTYELPGDWSIDFSAKHTGNNPFRRADQVWSYNLAAVLADPDPATALNPFCDTDAFTDCNNPATLERLHGYNIIAAKYRADDLVAKASGTLFDLPGGSMAFAIGGEFMKPELTTTITQLTTSPTVSVRETLAEREIKSGFAEVLLPIFGSENALPGLRKLELSAAVRYEDYSDFGSTTNPKYGLTWRPIDGLTFRGSYGTSFRAPTLTDIDFAATATYSVINILDPSTNTTIRAIQLLGGRPGLEPETADIYTFGVDFAPPALPGLRGSLTYYNIDYTNRITSLSSTTVLANPAVYGAFINPDPDDPTVLAYMNSVYYRSVPENPANIDAIIDARKANLGGLKQDGLDLSVFYDFPGFGGEWNVGLTATKILTSEQSVAEGLPYYDVLDQINNPVSLRARGNIGWSYGDMHINAFINHIGSYDNNLRTPVEKVDSWTTLDLNFAYETSKEGSGWMNGLRFGVSLVNATDADAPRVVNTTAAVEGWYDPQNASVIGRFVALEISKQW